MNAYKIETTITDDGKIILPSKLKKLFNHKVEVLVLEKETSKIKKSTFGVYDFGGQLDEINIRDFAYED